jgi:DNA replication protein DnaC
MNLQHERITELCEALKLSFVGQSYGVAAQKAAKDEMAYSDFLEALLREEMAGRTVRKQNMMTRLAGFPAIKTLEQFNYDFAKGVNVARSRSWQDWASSSETRTWCLLDRAAWARPTWRWRWATRPRRPVSRRAS